MIIEVILSFDNIHYDIRENGRTFSFHRDRDTTIAIVAALWNVNHNDNDKDFEEDHKRFLSEFDAVRFMDPGSVFVRIK